MNFNMNMSINSNKKKFYILGFLFSIVLTVLPFLLVIKKNMSPQITHFFIILFAIIQILVHFLFFLDLNFSREQRWNMVSLLFVMIIMFIIVFGSIWIMYNLNHHMSLIY